MRRYHHHFLQNSRISAKSHHEMGLELTTYARTGILHMPIQPSGSPKQLSKIPVNPLLLMAFVLLLRNNRGDHFAKCILHKGVTLQLKLIHVCNAHTYGFYF